MMAASKAGVVAKMYVFFAAMEGSMSLLAVVGVLTSVIGAFYVRRGVEQGVADSPIRPSVLATRSLGTHREKQAIAHANCEVLVWHPLPALARRAKK